MEWSFKVDGPLVAYTRTTQRQKWTDPAYKRYDSWKRYVRLAANVAEVPEHLSHNRRYTLEVIASWPGHARVDLDNLCKGIADGLWKQDRYLSRIYAEHIEEQGGTKEFVIISVSDTASQVI